MKREKSMPRAHSTSEPSRMSANPSDILDILKREVALLSVQLDSYQALFLLEQDKRKRLIEDTAPGFFALTQISMVESILMRVARLMDPEFTGKCSSAKRNASIRSLMHADANGSIKEKCVGLVESWDLGGPFHRIQELRNKYLGHNDLALWFGRPAGDSWIPISTEDFDALVELARKLWSLLRDIHQVVNGSELLSPAGIGGEHPTQILRCLAGSCLLDELLDRDCWLHEAASLSASITKRVGDETMLPCIESANAPAHHADRENP